MKKILIERGKRKEIVESLNTTYATVKTALNGTCDSLISQRIRTKALELGGEYKSEN